MPTALTEFKQAVVLNALRNCPLFAGSTPSNLDRIASSTVLKTLTRGEYLFYEGSAVEGFYIVQKGAIKLHRVNWSGKEQVIHVFRAYESFAEDTLVSDFGHPADACALEPAQVLLVQKKEFVALIKHEPELGLSMLRSLSQHFQTLLELFDDLTLKDVRTRLANWLIQHCPDPESYEPYEIQLPTSKRLLAAELGTVSETFSRTLAKLRSQKLLAVEGKSVTVLCPMKLSRLLRVSLGSPRARAAAPFWNGAVSRHADSKANLFHKQPKNVDKKTINVEPFERNSLVSFVDERDDDWAEAKY